MSSARWVLIVGVVVVLAGRAHAQSTTTGAIQGVITDSTTGETLAGVTVIASSPATPAQSALTDEHGAYKIAELPPGDYLVTFYYLDTTTELANVHVGVQKVTPVYQKLASGGGGEVVHVKATAPTIDPTSTAQGVTIDQNYLRNIPVPGRTFEAALGAAPGSQGDRGGVAFSGSSSLENQYYVDGVNTTGLSYGTVGTPVINDFIEEIEVITGGYNAEYGRATGGVINVVTKTGSNELKGSVFGSWQPGFLTAAVERSPRNAASLDVTAQTGYNADFGFELGGPIIKDKLWFFVGVAPALHRTDFVRVTKRQTDCHQVDDAGHVSDCNPKLPADGGYADSDPDVDPKTGFYITDDLDSETRTSNTTVYNLLGKINYALSPEQQGQLAIQALPASSRQPGLYGLPTTGYDEKTLTTDVSGKWTSKFADGKTEVEGALGWHHGAWDVDAIDKSLEDTPQQILFNGTLGTWAAGFGESQPTTRGCADDIPGRNDAYPFITNCPMNTRTYAVGGPGSLYRDREDRWAARVGVTQRLRAAGNHEIKGGLDTENNYAENTRAVSGGTYLINSINSEVDVERWVQIATMDDSRGRFDQICNTSAIANSSGATEYKCDYLQKLGDDGTTVTSNTFNWAGYLRDSWQIRPNLTLNAGVRYEEQRLRYADFLQHAVDPLTGDRRGKNALVLTGMLAPRLGILYDWTKEGRSKIYTHWGRFYESIPLEINDYNYGAPVIYLQGYRPNQCGMTDNRIGGPDASGCASSTDKPDVRQQLYGVNGSLTAPGVKAQYLDEIVAGVEYEVVDDLKLGIAFQDRRIGRIVEDVSTDGASTYVVSNPGEWSAAEEAKLVKKIDATTDPVQKGRLQHELELFRGIRIFDHPQRNYDSLTFTLTRRFSKSLYTQASYTYSRTIGDYPGLIPDSGGILPNNSTQYDLIELLANKLGPLPQDRPHYIKIDGYYKFDFKKHGDATFGIRFRALSGVPENALAAHSLYGPDQSFLLPRGSIGRSDFEHGLDIHAGYGKALPKHTHLDVFVDVYNVYNNQGTFAVDNTYAPESAVGTGAVQSANPVSGGTFEDLIFVKAIDTNGNETPTPIGRNPNFRNTTTRYAPAYIRLGMRLTF